MSLISLFKGLQQGFLKDVLMGAGLTLGTSAIALTALNTAISKVRNDVSQISADLLALMHISGIDIAMSITIGAILTRYTMKATKLTLQKAQ